MLSKLLGWPSRRRAAVVVSAGAFACVVAAACSSADSGGSSSPGGKGGSSGGGAGGGGGDGGQGGGFGGTGGDGGQGGGFDGSGGGAGDAGPCQSISAAAKPTVPNVLILLDLSGSMTKTVPPPNFGTRYSITKDAVVAVVNDPKIGAPLRMGLVYFGHAKNVAGCSGGCCTRNASNGGPDIPIKPLDAAQKSAIVGFMNAANGDDNNNTPTHGALLGAFDILKKSGLDGSHYVLLMTDGAENCGGNPVQTVADTGAAASGTPPVKTFVVGSPGSDAYRQTLSDIAKAGGTPKTPTCTGQAGNTCHFDLSDTTQDFKKNLTDALTAILGSVKVPCVYDIPPQDGGAFDPDKVNVEYKSGGGTPQPILQDANKPCDQAAGWQYSADKKQIIICGATCKAVQSDPNAQISIQFGCPTQKVK